MRSSRGPIPTADSSSSRLTEARCWQPIATPCRNTCARADSRPRIILATSPPEGLSLHNVLSGTVSAIHADPAVDQVVVQIAVGRILLLAEVTRDAIARLQIAVGVRLHALIKSVSLELAAPGQAD